MITDNPARHTVQFYERTEFLVSRITEHLASGLRAGDACLMVAMPSHRQAVLDFLPTVGLDPDGLVASNRLKIADAEDTLARFMVRGMPDPDRFRTAISGLLEPMGWPERPVRAFGEMVALLWSQGNEAAVCRLEEIWEEFAREKPVRVLCAYPLSGFDGEGHGRPFHEICAHHVDVLPSESFSAENLTERDRLRAIAHLQQKAARLEGQTREMDKQLRDLRQLHAVSLRLSSFADMEQTLEEVLRYALSVFGAEKGLLSLALPGGKGLRVGASLGFTPAFLERMELVPVGAGADGYCLLVEQPVVVADVEADPLFESQRALVQLGGFRAVHSIPLINREGKVTGVLSAHFARPHRPSDREMEFGEVYARLAADTIEQAELREEARRELEQRNQAEARLRVHARALEVLNRTGARLAAERDLETILQSVTDGGREITGAAFGAFFYNGISPEGEAYSLYTLSGASREAFAKFPMPRNTAIFGPTFEGRGVVRHDDVTAAPEYGKSGPHHGMPKGHLPVRSYLAVPVVSRDGGVLGGLFYGHPEVAVFNEESERLLVNLASQAAVAIDNAKLHASLEEELRQRKLSEEDALRFAAIVRSSNDAIVSKDLNAIVTSWNKSAERIFGWTAEEMIGQSITKLIPEKHIDEEPAILERIRRGETISHYQTVRRRKDGKLIDISLTVSPILDAKGRIVGASKVARDITDIRATEEQLRQAQKMEAVGRLAGGIAHDFNNLLTSINGFTEMAMAELPPGSAVADYLDEVRKSGLRAASLTQQLLAYSRKQILAPRILDVNAVVADLEKMLRRLIGEDIGIRTDLAPELSPVKADPSQLQQIIVNLALNARDAMPQGGHLVIRTADVFLEADHPSSFLEAAPGPHVLLSVSDNGMGMPPEVMEHLFEPFFTTKEVGKGTGLGLSSVYGIVKQSGGSISVRSEPGHGSVFEVYLPAASAKAQGPALPAVRPEAADQASGEVLLLAEDEDTVRKFLSASLRKQGYTVLEARDGTEALRVGGRAPRLDLLLTDVVMPNMNGGKLADDLRAVHPGLKVLFISGYTKDILSGSSLVPSGTGFLQKPFSQEELLRRIGEMVARIPRR